ncbi:MAG TPA: 50S ribosomal protein L11 methyltransferase [Balneolales bacterium]|nr:50S ribosomal protein L11 methyltransferase [Balneolales bacterium]
MPDNYITLNISIPFEYQELLIAELLDMDFHGFEQEDDQLNATISQNRYSDVIRQEIEEWLSLQPYPARIIGEHTDEPRDWNEEWERSIRPLVIGRFFVKPTWVDEPVPDGKILLEIDPKMAFGTGYHESTRLVLRLLPSAIRKGDTVLDVGTGTGILSIAALKLGAISAFGFDIDEWSSNNARGNAVINNVTDLYKIAEGSFEVVPGEGTYDVILANVNRNTLLEMQKPLEKHLKPGGRLFLSGLLETERPMMLEAPGFSRLKLENEMQEGEWIALLLTKPLPS